MQDVPARPVKLTAEDYGPEYQSGQLRKYRGRATNHWRHRISLAHWLVDQYCLPRLGARRPADVTVVDVGCSIGTIALEFAARGFRTYGVDLDEAGLSIARGLAEERGVRVEWLRRDVADWDVSLGRIDIAAFFDVFEHLHDDELGSLLSSIRRQLSPCGSIVFHTFPTQYNYLFYSQPLLRMPLIPMRWLPEEAFLRLARSYASIIDAGLLLSNGVDSSQHREMDPHCNPLTVRRLRGILVRAGFDVVVLESTQLFGFQPAVMKWFRAHPIADRNIFGVAVPRPGGAQIGPP